jgi:cytochrome c-type biogenesis protein CcmH
MNSGTMWVFIVLAVLLLGACSASLYWVGRRSQNTPGSQSTPRGQSLALMLAVPVAVVVVYFVIGQPGALQSSAANSAAAGTDMNDPHGAAGMAGMGSNDPNDPHNMDPNAMVQRLADHLKQHPEDTDDWLMLARSYGTLGRYAEADDAYQHAQTKVMQDSGLLINWIELRLMLNNSKLDARTNQLIDRAAVLAPDDSDVMLLRALADFNRGDKAGADDLVRKLHDRYPPGNPDRPSLDAALAKMMPSSAASKP